MDDTEHTYRMAVVGGGPVGLFLGCCMHSAGIPVIILEKRIRPVTHSRSLGIHPVVLERFDKLGMAKPFLRHGRKVRRGHAFSGGSKLGTVSFNSCPGPYPFILTLPQYKTEQLLEQHLNSLDPDILHRGAEVTDIRRQANKVQITFNKDGRSYTCCSEFLAGCDGKNSLVRKAAGISVKGGPYPDTYVMGDFRDHTDFGSDAAIFLEKEGLVESFPIPGGWRRWVVKTDHYHRNVSVEELQRYVAQRTGYDLSGLAHRNLSAFGTQKLFANPIAKGRFILAGDAAHVISPIGGQGMNLGWLDAWDLAEVFGNMGEHSAADSGGSLLQRYARRRKQIARRAARRAEWNMKIGRRSDFHAVKTAVMRLLLHSPARHLLARLFTMRNLDGWLLRNSWQPLPKRDEGMK